MIYDKSFLNKAKIPTGAALFVILLVVFFLGRFLTFSNTSPSRASKIALSRLDVVNISSTQAVVVWMTPQKTAGSVLFGEQENALVRVVFDERDTQSKKNQYRIHYAVLRNLKENTDYFFKVLADNEFIAAGGGKPYRFKTAKTTSAGINTQPAYGKIIQANGLPVEGALVWLTLEKALPVATITKSTGEWLIPVNILLDSEFMKPKTLAPTDTITIEIVSEDGEQSVVTVNTENLPALQTPLTIGKNYSFIMPSNVLSAVDYAKTPPAEEISILFPGEGSIIPGQSPLIKGKALPGASVSIMLDAKFSSEQKIKADKEGIWKAEFSSKLAPGKHTLSLTTKDAKEKEITLKRTFTIAKGGEQVLGNATPEARPTVTPTIQPFPTPTSQPQTGVIGTPTPVPPVSGANANALILGSFSAIILGIGLMLAF